MLLENLKQATQQQHAALELLNGLPGSLSEYRSLLESFYGFVTPWEARLAEMLPANDPIREGREKSAWLRADLAHLGGTEAELIELPQCDDLPAAYCRAEILGAAYVLEGSTLGGQFIARHLDRVLGPCDGGRSYFLSYGPRVGPMWQAFRQELLAASSPERDPIIIAAARNTFSKLHAWFALTRSAKVPA